MTRCLRRRAAQAPSRAGRGHAGPRGGGASGLQDRVGMRRSQTMPAPGPARAVRRKPRQLGSKVTHPKGAKAAFTRATATFDGREFVLSGDRKELLRVPAESGRPGSVEPAHARSCGGATTESYLNNPRYVGIRDRGAIPEGSYSFRVTGMATFNTIEQLQLQLGGNFRDPFGRNLHGGDWGSGRVPLSVTRIKPGPKGCGNTARRSGFYLHGGIMPGSSGCIDVGNSGYDAIVRALMGYRGRITVRVKYTHAAPPVSAWDRFLGGLAYPDSAAPSSESDAEPSLWDRIRSGLGQLAGGTGEEDGE